VSEFKVDFKNGIFKYDFFNMIDAFFDLLDYVSLIGKSILGFSGFWNYDTACSWGNRRGSRER